VKEGPEARLNWDVLLASGRESVVSKACNYSFEKNVSQCLRHTLFVPASPRKQHEMQGAEVPHAGPSGTIT
jgi:hypothetical protein